MAAACRQSLMLLGLFFVLMVPRASADIVVQLDSLTPDSVYAGYYRWSYSVFTDSTDGMMSAFFTLYDFDSAILTIEPPGDWNVSQSLVGGTPTGLNPADDPAIGNLTFAFSGSRPGTTFVGFDIIAASGDSILDDYSWQDRDAYPTGTLQSGLGQVLVAGSSPTVVPEPSSLALLGLGCAALAARRKRPRFQD